jgi:hypothetical protein
MPARLPAHLEGQEVLLAELTCWLTELPAPTVGCQQVRERMTLRYYAARVLSQLRSWLIFVTEQLCTRAQRSQAVGYACHLDTLLPTCPSLYLSWIRSTITTVGLGCWVRICGRTPARRVAQDGVLAFRLPSPDPRKWA